MAFNVPMGDFQAAAVAMSPSPAPSLSAQGRVPSGRTPNAKRPITPDTINVSNTGDRVLDLADMTAGFNTLSKQVSRDSQLLDSTSKAVEWNSQLLNALVTRVNTLEAGNNVMSQTVDSLTKEVTDAVRRLQALT